MRRCRNFLCLDYFLGTRRGLLLHLEESKNVRGLFFDNVTLRDFLVDAIKKHFYKLHQLIVPFLASHQVFFTVLCSNVLQV